MNIACITDRAYQLHQKEYLEPAVISIWDTKQAELLAQCRASGNPRTIGGDGHLIVLGILPNMGHTE